MTSPKAEALRLAGLGYPVFPCAPGRKAPATPKGVDNATTEAAIVERFFTALPTANVAIHCRGLLVVDVDGDANPWLQTEHGKACWAAAGAVSRSASGGRHFWFRLPAGAECGNAANRIAPKVDQRSTGGYILVAPSRTDKGAYAWEQPLEAPPAGLPEAPAWLVELAKPKPVPPLDHEAIGVAWGDAEKRAAAWLAKAPESVQGANGSGALFWAARGLVHGFGLGEEQALAMLAADFNPRCVPPWSAKELRHKVADAAAKPFDKPRGWLLNAKLAAEVPDADLAEFLASLDKPASAAAVPAVSSAPAEPTDEDEAAAGWQPFPVEALPAAMREFVEAGAHSLSVDPAMFVPHCLAVAAAAIGNACSAEVYRDWREPSILWACVSARSGSMKSPPFRLATRPMEAIKAERVHEWRIKVYDARRDMAEGGPKTFVPPPLSIGVIEDATVESLWPTLRDNPRGLLLAADELGGWFGSFGLYKRGGATADATQWIKCHGGGGHMVNRKGSDGPLMVPAATVSVCGNIQPGILRMAATEENRKSGLLARLLVAEPPTRAPTLDRSRAMPDAVAGRWDACVRALAGLPLDEDAGSGDPQPRVLPYTEAAYAAFKPWNDRISVLAYRADPELSAALSKLRAAAVRIALVLQLCHDPAATEIGERATLAGMRIADWFHNEAKRLYGRLFRSDAEDELAELVEWLRRRGGKATLKMLYSSGPRAFRGKSKAEAAAAKLAASGAAKLDGEGKSQTLSLTEAQ